MFMAIEDLFPVNILKMTLIKLAGMFLHFSILLDNRTINL